MAEKDVLTALSESTAATKALAESVAKMASAQASISAAGSNPLAFVKQNARQIEKASRRHSYEIMVDQWGPTALGPWYSRGEVAGFVPTVLIQQAVARGHLKPLSRTAPASASAKV